jgi:hypothetical protein
LKVGSRDVVMAIFYHFLALLSSLRLGSLGIDGFA